MGDFRMKISKVAIFNRNIKINIYFQSNASQVNPFLDKMTDKLLLFFLRELISF